MRRDGARSYREVTNTSGRLSREREGIMAFDDNTYSASLSNVIRDSYNDDETNTSTTTWTVSDSGNEDNSTTDSGNTDNTATDSFHWNSYNTDNSMDHSGNSWSYSSTDDHSDNSQNTYTDSSDHSVNAGVRSYSVGAGGEGAAAAAGAGSATIIDQSLNANILADGPVLQHVGSTAIVGSGEDSMVAGGDIDVSYDIDQSTNISAGGDVLIDGSTKTVTETIDSGNTSNFSWSYEDNSMDVDIDDSYNTWTHDTTVTDSFNEDSSQVFDTSITVDLDAIVDSDGAAIADDLDITL